MIKEYTYMEFPMYVVYLKANFLRMGQKSSQWTRYVDGWV